MSGFKVGDEVVCVDAGFNPSSGAFAPMLVEGSVYVVSEIGIEPSNCIAWLNVEGVDSRSICGLDARRFRPVHRTKTDLSIEAFSTIKPGQYEEPKRVERVKKGVGV